ncbi:MAG: glucuronate isomerase [Deltaproteobacteria bacterium]|nr:glucuronate isomerase [Deltaproteobacteria bacterium]
MKPFLDENFLLETKTAERLYFDYAADQPIIDYHCHLPPDQLADNHRFATLTQIWLDGDHYKWRAMRSNGVPERFCTGDASDWEKFEMWAKTVPFTLRNPLYHWTHMELRKPFGVKDTLLGPATARSIYDHCNKKLAQDDFTTQGLLRQFQVVVVCTTDDPVDTLEAHQRYARTPGAATRVFPAWRPDRAMAVSDLRAWNLWVDKLQAAANVAVDSFATLLAALQRRHDFFHRMGCRVSDHGIEQVCAEPYTAKEIDAIFAKARSQRPLSPLEQDQLRSAVLYELAVMDHASGWTQQLHLGAMRNNSTRMMRSLGPDTGFDSIGDYPQASALARFLDRLDATNQLGKTILYNLNPADNEVMATMLGNFQDGSCPGKIQLGSAWWFLDQKDGMERQLGALSALGLLSRFVGMLTDSRSFLSYSRHEYFRRLLCNLLGNDVEQGLVPHDMDLLGNMVRDICYRNAKSYFGFPEVG